MIRFRFCSCCLSMGDSYNFRLCFELHNVTPGQTTLPHAFDRGAMRPKCSWLFLLFQLRRPYSSYTDPLKNANGCQSYAVSFLDIWLIHVCETVCNRDISVCLWQFNTHYASNSTFREATFRDYICLLVRITNRWYVRNHFISNVLKRQSYSVSTQVQ